MHRLVSFAIGTGNLEQSAYPLWNVKLGRLARAIVRDIFLNGLLWRYLRCDNLSRRPLRLGGMECTYP